MRLLKTLLNEAGTDFKKVRDTLVHPMAIFGYGVALWAAGFFGVVYASAEYLGTAPYYVLPTVVAYIAFTAIVYWFTKLLQRTKERIRRENKDTMDALSGNTTPRSSARNPREPYHAGSRETI